ncbi:sigma-54-dependent transcriptional regulator [Alkalispirochaeta alkalica]|uniref:sigma-54-dependent transcriptional regulator n=1 Tax=Alkalispirochaeta alkalica TaxID=46356 RepID=UPI000381BE9D|nr:sigma-54 dependent transcriptional regulator [Alkalispirochaeta alkalica]
MKTIWVIDDEENMRIVLAMLLEQQGYHPVLFPSGDQALNALKRSRRPDCLLSDLRMPGMDGLELLSRVKAVDKTIPFVVLTGFGTIELAVQAIKSGAEDFLTKPFEKDEVLRILERVLPRSGEDPSRTGAEQSLIFESGALENLVGLIEKLALSPVPVLITGESGTGKEGIARALHRETQRHRSGQEGPFVALNCAAIPLTLFESELFGHRKGAFTGALEDAPGKIAQAQDGTLLLDEIGDLPLDAQTKLLRFLEDYRYRPLGAGQERTARVRIICATNRDLHAMIAEGTFRQDLYYRISTFVLTIPPLRERREDILPIAGYFLRRFSRSTEIQNLTDEARAKLLAWAWPGNVRELRSVIQRAVILVPQGVIPATAIVFDPGTAAGEENSKEEGLSALERAEKQTLEQFLRSTRGNVSKTAELIGVSRSTLRYRLEKYGLTGRERW